MLQSCFGKTFEYLKNQQKYNFHNFSNFIAIFCFLHSMINKQTINILQLNYCFLTARLQNPYLQLKTYCTFVYKQRDKK